MKKDGQSKRQARFFSVLPFLLIKEPQWFFVTNKGLAQTASHRVLKRICVRIKFIGELFWVSSAGHQSCSPAHGAAFTRRRTCRTESRATGRMSLVERKKRERKKIKKMCQGKFLCDSRSLGAGLFCICWAFGVGFW